jgi:hypothetical protein
VLKNGFPEAKALSNKKGLIAALKRCATQNQKSQPEGFSGLALSFLGLTPSTLLTWCRRS